MFASSPEIVGAGCLSLAAQRLDLLVAPVVVQMHVRAVLHGDVLMEPRLIL